MPLHVRRALLPSCPDRRVLPETAPAPGGGRRLGSTLALLLLLACCGLLPAAPTLIRRSRWGLLVPSPYWRGRSCCHLARCRRRQCMSQISGKPNHKLIDGDLTIPELAQSFITGGTSSSRFTLNSVVVDFTAHANQATIKIHTSSSGDPGTQIGGALTRTGSSTSGDITFNAPTGANAITLNGSTTYFVRFESSVSSSNTNRPVLQGTSNTAEDSTSSTGWSIVDTGQYCDSCSNFSATTGTAFSLRINFTVNATKTTLSASTGYITSGNASSVNYGGTNLGTAGDHTSFNSAYSSGSLLRGDYTSLSSPSRLVCAAGTLEFGWYWRHQLRSRLGTVQVLSQNAARIYRADYTPTSGNGAEYLFLAYCTIGSGSNKQYSTPVDLLGRKAKEEAPFSQATRVTVSYSSSASFSNFTAKNTTRATCDPSSRDLYDARYNPSYAHCLEWDGFSGATAFYLRRESAGVTASTDCSTALSDNTWSPDTVRTAGSKMQFTEVFASYDRGKSGSCGSDKFCILVSFPYVCYQVQARNSGMVVGTSPAILVKFGGTKGQVNIQATATAGSPPSTARRSAIVVRATRWPTCRPR